MRRLALPSLTLLLNSKTSMFKRLLQWLRCRRTAIIKIIQYGDPREHFVSIKVTNDVHAPDERFDLVFSLTTVTTICGITFGDVDHPYSRIRFTSGETYYTPFDINDLLEMLSIDTDDDDDDDDDDWDDEPVDDGPSPITEEQFNAMLSGPTL